MTQSTIENGHSVRDVITYFSGVVTGVVSYITGCDQALITPPMNSKGEFPDPRWIDVQRLEITGERGQITLDNTLTPGFDLLPPVR